MASVRLKFNVPDPEATWVKLYIFEATAKDGVFNTIETVTQLGTKPNYIDEYTTNLATSQDDWFAIQWEDDKGATTDVSNPIQGRTSSLVGQIVSRVMQRNSTLSQVVVTQEAESAIQYYLNDDPYASTEIFNYVELRGLTNLTMAMSYLAEMAQMLGASWTAGIVSMKISDAALKQRADSIEKLIKQANKDLGISFSIVAYLENLEIAGGMQQATIDQSRLLIELR